MASLGGKYLVAEPLLLPVGVACKILLVAVQGAGPSGEALLLLVVGHQQWQLDTSNSSEAELGTGHIQQVFQGFDCPISPESIFCSHQGTSESAQS